MLNITIEVFLTSFSVIMMLISALIIFRQYKFYPDNGLILMGVAWLSFAMFQLMSVIAYILMNTQIFLMKNIFLVLLVIIAQATLNIMNNGKALDLKLLIITFISAGDLAILLLPNNVREMQYPNGDASLANAGYNRLFMASIFFYLMTIYFMYALKIYRNAPKTLQKETRLFLVGNIILGPLGFLSFVSGISAIIPGIVDIILGLGILVSSIGLVKTPKILYILPFQAVKLSAISKDTGMIIYTYDWTKDFGIIKDELYASALLSINMFTKESLGRGDLAEIKLDYATILISSPNNLPVYYTVIATKTSHTLRIGLEKFAQSFYEKFKVEFEKAIIYDLSQFNTAKDLIEDCFPYIPNNN